MDNIEQAIAELGEKIGLNLALDDAKACVLPLEDGRQLHIQVRGDVGEVDFAATLGTVPEGVRSGVFLGLLAANFYWNETLGGTISWQNEVEQVVYAFPLPVATLDSATLERVFTNFLHAQKTWADRLKNDVSEALVLRESADTFERETAAMIFG